MKNRIRSAIVLVGVAAATAAGQQQLQPLSNVRVVDGNLPVPAGTWQSATGAQSSEASRYGAAGLEDLRITVEVPTRERLRPFRQFVINPWERQNDPARFEIRGGGTQGDIRNYSRVTNPFLRNFRFTADRLEEARQAWLRDNGYVGGVRSFGGSAETATSELPQPRATIRMPAGSSGSGGYRVRLPDREHSVLRAMIARMHEERVQARKNAADQSATESQDAERAPAVQKIQFNEARADTETKPADDADRKTTIARAGNTTE